MTPKKYIIDVKLEKVALQNNAVKLSYSSKHGFVTLGTHWES